MTTNTKTDIKAYLAFIIVIAVTFFGLLTLAQNHRAEQDNARAAQEAPRQVERLTLISTDKAELDDLLSQYKANGYELVSVSNNAGKYTAVVEQEY